jgi:hypothetical protein
MAALVLLIASVGFAGLGTQKLRTDIADAPVAVVANTDELSQALQDAPWVGAEMPGRQLWLISRVDCTRCRTLHHREVALLQDQGIDVRVILLAPDDAAANHPSAAYLAALFRSREWQAFAMWAEADNQGEFYRTLASEVREPAEIEGYLEWARASWRRVETVLAENDIETQTPLFLWRRGQEWRASPAVSARALESVRRDLAAVEG